MTIAAVDPSTVIVQFARTSGTDFNGLVGSRVYNDVLSSSWNEADGAAVVVSVDLSGTDFETPLHRCRASFRVYGGEASGESTRERVRRVCRALHDIAHGLNGSVQSAGVIVSSAEVQRLQSLWDEKLQTWYGVCLYEMEIRSA